MRIQELKVNKHLLAIGVGIADMLVVAIIGSLFLTNWWWIGGGLVVLRSSPDCLVVLLLGTLAMKQPEDLEHYLSIASTNAVVITLGKFCVNYSSFFAILCGRLNLLYKGMKID